VKVVEKDGGLKRSKDSLISVVTGLQEAGSGIHSGGGGVESVTVTVISSVGSPGGAAVAVKGLIPSKEPDARRRTRTFPIRFLLLILVPMSSASP
jgi:hypothetical protein